MNREEVFERIAKQVGRKPISCNCEICRSMCLRVPCLGTPQDILALIDSGYKDKVCYTEWAAGMIYGHTRVPIPMVQIKAYNDGRCVFFQDGKCELHDKGLKPTEGRLASHDFHEKEIQKEYNLTYQVAREWFQEENFVVIKEIADKLCDYMNKKK